LKLSDSLSLDRETAGVFVMRILRLSFLFFVIGTVVCLRVLAGEPSDPGARSNQTNPNATQELPAATPSNLLAVTGQKPHIRLSPAVAFNSGGVGPDGVAIADLNGDGKLDLVVANYCQSVNQSGDCIGEGEVAVLLGNGDGTFDPAMTYNTAAYDANMVVVGDLNGDGKLDLAVANWSGNSDHIILQGKDLYDQSQLSRRPLPQSQLRNGEAGGEPLADRFRHSAGPPDCMSPTGRLPAEWSILPA
jgi:FG-GAP-like repeat